MVLRGQRRKTAPKTPRASKRNSARDYETLAWHERPRTTNIAGRRLTTNKRIRCMTSMTNAAAGGYEAALMRHDKHG